MDDDFNPEIPDYDCPHQVGDIVTVSGSLSTRNDVGGTELLKHSGVECEVTKAFWDYEAGWRFWGRVVDQAAVDEFRTQASTGIDVEVYREKYPANPALYTDAVAARAAFDPGDVRFSEHDIAPAPAVGVRLG